MSAELPTPAMFTFLVPGQIILTAPGPPTPPPPLPAPPPYLLPVPLEPGLPPD